VLWRSVHQMLGKILLYIQYPRPTAWAECAISDLASFPMLSLSRKSSSSTLSCLELTAVSFGFSLLV
jgi:hypothetical protein